MDEGVRLIDSVLDEKEFNFIQPGPNEPFPIDLDAPLLL
jgi:hypothetical protein